MWHTDTCLSTSVETWGFLHHLDGKINPRAGLSAGCSICTSHGALAVLHPSSVLHPGVGFILNKGLLFVPSARCEASSIRRGC